MPPGGWEPPPPPAEPESSPGPLYWLRFAGIVPPLILLAAFLLWQG